MTVIRHCIYLCVCLDGNNNLYTTEIRLEHLLLLLLCAKKHIYSYLLYSLILYNIIIEMCNTRSVFFFLRNQFFRSVNRVFTRNLIFNILTLMLN